MFGFLLTQLAQLYPAIFARSALQCNWNTYTNGHYDLGYIDEVLRNIVLVQ